MQNYKLLSPACCGVLEETSFSPADVAHREDHQRHSQGHLLPGDVLAALLALACHDLRRASLAGDAQPVLLVRHSSVVRRSAAGATKATQGGSSWRLRVPDEVSPRFFHKRFFSLLKNRSC